MRNNDVYLVVTVGLHNCPHWISPIHGKFNKNNYGLRLLQVGNATIVQALQVGERREGREALHCALWLRVRGRWARL